MEILQTVLYVLIVIASVLLILLVLAQSNKGSDLGLFGGSTEMVFGSQKGNILTRTTAILATVVIAGSFFMGVMKVQLSKDKVQLEQQMKQEDTKTLDDLQKTSSQETGTLAPAQENPVK